MIYRFKNYERSEIIRNHLNMGGSNKEGERIDVTSLYFERGGKAYLPVMGEYHFSRDKRENWYGELCKMKAGGVDIVATYLFWIYHEEIEGEFDFSGDLDIREFILDAEKAGLDVIIRIGPWAHGECRNGGFPDWLLKKGYKLRDNNPDYMAKARIWYEKIYEEVKGLFYKDGGRIIGVQFENELVNNSEHLALLKKTALEIGYDAPIYTVTGWNSLYGAKIPVDEVVPVFAAYGEAPWAGHTKEMSPSPHFAFNTTRNDSAVGVDIINPTAPDGWVLPYKRYPFATCELGAGTHPTHHRRGLVTPMDAYAMSLVKLGCGNNLVGYYMYHGGVNRIGKLSTFNESKETGYPNDYPILNYDYNTCLSSYGEAGEQYGLLNMLHMFIGDFGEGLAVMESVEAENFVPETDFEGLRYTMRCDGESGFIFVNHHQRLHKLKDVKNVTFKALDVVFPEIDVKGDVSFILPFNLKMGEAQLEYATAQLLCVKDDTYFFMAIDGIEPVYKFRDKEAKTVTLSFDEAKYLRKINGEIYLGDKCNVYICEGEIRAIERGNVRYKYWDGEKFVEKEIRDEYTPCQVTFTDTKEPFVPGYISQLNFNGERKRWWKRIEVSSPDGFMEIDGEYDVAQIYADGELTADNFYTGKVWRVPCSLCYNKESYLVMSEMKEDFYKEEF